MKDSTKEKLQRNKFTRVLYWRTAVLYHFAGRVVRFFIRGLRKIWRLMKKCARKLRRLVRICLKKVYRLIRIVYKKVRRPFILCYKKIRNWIIREKKRAKRRKARRIKKREKEKTRKAFEKLIQRRNRSCRATFLEEVQPVLQRMPESNGSRYYRKSPVKIAVVADTFLYDSLKDAADFIRVTPDNYREYADKADFFLVASAWRGIEEEWQYMSYEGYPANDAIREAITAFREAGKPVVFYSKEDPPHYERFLPIAKMCDYVFTSCAEKMEEYRRDCGHERVYTMEFCINPVFHNPVGIHMKERRDGIVFAGSWMTQHPERVIALEKMLDGAVSTGKEMVMADRNFERENIRYMFPEKYFPYITKSIGHDDLQKVHKLYNWAININTVTNSRSMFANRAYELQANGVLMISNYSLGISEKFPEILIVDSPEESAAAIGGYDPEETYRHQIAGVRRVMTGETGFDRVNGILKLLKLQEIVLTCSILIVAEELTDSLKEQFAAQSVQNARLIAAQELTNELYASYDIVGRWCKDSSYGKYYLEDMANGFKYTDSDYITKASRIVNGKLEGSVEHDYVSRIEDVFATLFWRKSISMEEFMAFSGGEKNNGYSIDRFNYEK